jgi:hypothetical protein
MAGAVTSPTSSPRGPKSERGERITEDENARDTLGGVKGAEKLPPAPMTKQEKQQTPDNDDPGHVA